MEVNSQLHFLTALPHGRGTNWILGWLGPRAVLAAVISLMKRMSDTETGTATGHALSKKLFLVA